jgi:hypothetical protein
MRRGRSLVSIVSLRLRYFENFLANASIADWKGLATGT